MNNNVDDLWQQFEEQELERALQLSLASAENHRHVSGALAAAGGNVSQLTQAMNHSELGSRRGERTTAALFRPQSTARVVDSRSRPDIQPSALLPPPLSSSTSISSLNNRKAKDEVKKWLDRIFDFLHNDQSQTYSFEELDMLIPRVNAIRSLNLKVLLQNDPRFFVDGDSVRLKNKEERRDKGNSSEGTRPLAIATTPRSTNESGQVSVETSINTSIGSRTVMHSTVLTHPHASDAARAPRITETADVSLGRNGGSASFSSTTPNLRVIDARFNSGLNQPAISSSPPTRRQQNPIISSPGMGANTSIVSSTTSSTSTLNTYREDTGVASVTTGERTERDVVTRTREAAVSDFNNRTSNNDAGTLPFSLWFDAFRVWPNLRAELTRDMRRSGVSTSPPTFYVGFGVIAEITTRPSPSSTLTSKPVYSVQIRTLELANQQSMKGIFENEMRIAFLGLTNERDEDDDESAFSFTPFDSLIENSKKPSDFQLSSKMNTNESTSTATGGGSFVVGDIVAVLVKTKETHEAAPVRPPSTKTKRCKKTLAQCKYGATCTFSHSEEEREEAEKALANPVDTPPAPAPAPVKRIFLEGIARLECAATGAVKSAKEWAENNDEVAPGGSLAALAAAQKHVPSFLSDLAKKLRLSSSNSNVQDASSCRVVLSALLLLPKTWEQLQEALGSSQNNHDSSAALNSIAALKLLVAAARTIEDRILSAVASRLERCITFAAMISHGRNSQVSLLSTVPSLLGTLVGALVSRLPVAVATIDSPALRALRAAVTRPSYKTPWLELPLVPTIFDIQSRDRWLSKVRLNGLKGTYKDKNEYLERLFRLLRADALADMSIRISDLARGNVVPDRELRRFKNIRAEGYRAKGGALQVAFSFTPVTKPRNNDAEKAKLLMDGSLVCIAPRGNWKDLATLQWAVVVGTPPGALNMGIVVLEILPGTGTDAVEALRAILGAPQGASVMAENPEYFTAARFALNRIQALGGKNDQNDDVPPELPFVEELVSANAQYAEGFSGHNAKTWKSALNAIAPEFEKKPFVSQLDQAQRSTIVKALMTRVWICQGPPGTGKTTASVAYFSTLNSLPETMRSSKPVLMLAVKNHALDQFLERVIRDNPGIGAIRVGGKSASEALTAINLASVRKETEDKCRLKKAEKDVFGAWCVKGKSHSELKVAQGNLAEALDGCLNKQVLRAADFLNTLSAKQLDDLVRNAPEHALTSISVDGVDLVGAWAEQLSGLRSNNVTFENGDAFISHIKQAPSLTDLKVVNSDALESAEVIVGEKGSVSRKLPTLLDVVNKALRSWVKDIDCSDTKSMFQMTDSSESTESRYLVGSSTSDALPVVNASSEDDATDLDTIIREARAAEVLDDRDDDVEEEEEEASQSHRRTAKPREGRAGLLDTLHMTRLGSTSADNPSLTLKNDPLSSVDFTSKPLVPAFASELDATFLDEAQIWSLNFRGRALLLHRAAKNLSLAAESAYAKALPAFREAENAEAMARANFDATAVLSILKGRGVIGMTINGAAKYSSLLSVLKPEVVIVEEAAEVKEPLLVAALPSSARFLFMAGDHKQLPPKPAYYPFSKDDFKLNLSLFRRLIEENVDHGRLCLQNRMQKKLADVVRALGTYSDVNNGYDDGSRITHIQDAAAHVNPNHGPFWKHAAYWWCHTDREASDGNGEYKHNGHSNEPEAKRVASAVAWHMINGVHPSRIVVLTGYAAQVALIRKLLLKPEILPNETIEEARKGPPEGEIIDKTPSTDTVNKKTSTNIISESGIKRPRVCTVDEFQGDEADHVILSLVRSGGDKLGFLKDSERLVVAISRARRSLLIVGNRNHFCALSRDWKLVVNHLEKFDAIGPNLPLLCPRHPDSHGTVASSADQVPIKPSLRKCQLKCIDKLSPCGHNCTNPVCHSDSDHAAMICKVVKDIKEPKCNHNIRAECWKFTKALPSLPPCETDCNKLMKCGHPCPNKCHVDVDSNHDQAMHDCKFLVNYRHVCGHEVKLECREVNEKSTATPICEEPCTLFVPDPCGHPCQKKCGERCSAGKDGGSCPVCVMIREDERRIKVEAREAMSRLQVEIAINRAKEIAISNKDKSAVELSPDGADYERVKEQVQRSVQKGHDIGIRILKIEQLENSERLREHFLAVADMNDPSTTVTKLFHGTSDKNAKGIHENGFEFKRSRASAGTASHKKNMLGAAVYLCPDSSKAAREEYMGGKKGVLLLCDVFLGSAKVVAEPDETLDDPERRKTERYDSVMMRRSTQSRKSAVMYDEYAIYDARLVLPQYKISIEIVTGAPKGDFGVIPKVIGDVAFYDITFDDVKKQGLENYSVEAHHFYKAQTLLTQLSTQLSKLSDDFKGKKLTRLTYCDNRKLEERFQDAKRTLEKREIQVEERFVFHGTNDDNLEKIQINGFLVGGVDLPAANGARYGPGIYLGLTPELSAVYAKGSTSMLLVKVLSGNIKNEHLLKTELESAISVGKFQSYEPANDMLIVASSAQILPCYVVHWGENDVNI